MIVLTKPSDINAYRILALKGALKLETKGMTSRGRSAYSIVKQEFGFKGNKLSVLTQLEAWIEVNLMGVAEGEPRAKTE